MYRSASPSILFCLAAASTAAAGDSDIPEMRNLEGIDVRQLDWYPE